MRLAGWELASILAVTAAQALRTAENAAGAEDPSDKTLRDCGSFADALLSLPFSAGPLRLRASAVQL